MYKIEEQPKKGLLLVNHSKVFETMEAALGKVGCNITDDFDAISEVDLVVMDSFYLKSGMADFAKRKNGGIFTLLVLFQHETRVFQDQFAEKIDHAIVLEPHKPREELFFSAVDELRNTWDFSFSKLSSK